jgi:hypothetical protein
LCIYSKERNRVSLRTRLKEKKKSNEEQRKFLSVKLKPFLSPNRCPISLSYRNRNNQSMVIIGHLFGLRKGFNERKKTRKQGLGKEIT